MKRKDFFLIAGILLCALALYAGLRLWGQEAGGRAVVSIDGKEVAVYLLQENLELDILSADGGYNHLSIQNGTASVTDANCPDKLCVHQKKIQFEGEMIICLPHKLVIQMKGGEEAPIDGVAQ